MSDGSTPTSPLIRLHAFNSAWWGDACGIVDDLALFQRSINEIREALAPWAWVELRGEPDRLPPPATLAAAGFFPADTQILFRLGLANLTTTPSTARLSVRFGDEGPLVVSAHDMAEFRYERFRYLPGADELRIRDRYAQWTRELVTDHPSTCLAVSDGDVDDPSAVQGWFVSRPTDRGLNLTLAMMRSGARISGHLLYQRACLAYAARGHRLGWASFSASNSAVLNIYASLGARFTGTEHFWLWVRS
jgi:hypothetical protein